MWLRNSQLLAERLELLQVRIEADRLILSVPDRQDDQARQRSRQRLERWLGIELEDWPAEKGLKCPEVIDPRRPTVLLLDEPTTGFDEQREVRLLNLLRSLSFQGCTVVIVTHSLKRLHLFDRVLVFADGGRLIFDGPPAQSPADEVFTEAPAAAPCEPPTDSEPTGNEPAAPDRTLPPQDPVVPPRVSSW